MKKMNFGCGRDIKPGYLNVDFNKFEGVDMTFDFNKFPYPFPDNNFDEVMVDNVLEHLNIVALVMKELHRVTKDGGLIRIIVPYYNCYGAYNSVEHKHFFSHKSFEGFYKRDVRGNHLGDNIIEENFKLKSLKLMPTRFGKIFLFDFIRKPISFVLGQVIKGIDITLIVEK